MSGSLDSSVVAAHLTGKRPVGRAMRDDLLPQLVAHARRTAPADRVDTRPIVAADVARFVRDALAHDEERLGQRVQELLAAGATVERLCLDLFAPAANRLGEMWDHDETDFVEVTLGVGRIQRVVRDLARTLHGAALTVDGGQVFLGGLPDEQHSLGLAMVAEFFVHDGWGVTVGPPLGLEELEQAVATRWYDVVGLAAAVQERIPRLAEAITAVRRRSCNPDVVVLVGGRAFSDRRALVEEIGADGWAPDAVQAPVIARDIVSSRRVNAGAVPGPA
ncbi:MAG: cobalamin B12-binding domain-containing protein [Gemmatimonadaceae bacterium]|nr:cobalamin B12-binding domain-containing protein [Gemmatimonadaceae bacterium]